MRARSVESDVRVWTSSRTRSEWGVVERRCDEGLLWEVELWRLSCQRLAVESGLLCWGQSAPAVESASSYTRTEVGNSTTLHSGKCMSVANLGKIYFEVTIRQILYSKSLQSQSEGKDLFSVEILNQWALAMSTPRTRSEIDLLSKCFLQLLRSSGGIVKTKINSNFLREQHFKIKFWL